MKQLFWLFVICLFLLPACKKDNNAGIEIISFTPGKGAYNLRVYIRGTGFDSVMSNTRVTFNGAEATILSVSDSSIVAVVPVNATTGRIFVSIGNKTVRSSSDFVILSGKWTQKGVLPTNKERVLGLGFSVGNKGYLTTGDRLGYYVPSSDRMNDMLEYDPATGVWTEKAPLSLKLAGGLGMVINNKIYVGVGQTDQGERTNQFWEYDPATNQWTRKADFPGVPRNMGIGLATGGKGYAGTGLFDGTTGLNDWWQYDPVTNAWTRKADFPGPARHLVSGFGLNGKVYAGAGPGVRRDWWEYEPTTDVWTKKKDYPGNMAWGAYGVIVGNRGYIMGAGIESWEYVPATDTWVQHAFFGPRYMGVAFGIGNKGYYATGATVINGGGAGEVLAEDVWEFVPGD